MVGAGAYDGKAGGEINAFVHCYGFEGGETLVVVHREHAVKTAVVPGTKEAVCSIGAEALYAFFVERLLNGWHDDVVLFCAQDTVLASVGVERQHGDAGAVNIEVAFQRCIEQAQFLAYALNA